MIKRSSIKKILPKRSAASNKTSGGKVLIVGGGKGLYGAGLLAALAATRTGAGYTHLMTDLSAFPWLRFPDFIVHPLKKSEFKNKEDYVIGIGPGLGITKDKYQMLLYLMKKQFSKVVVDADALSLIALYHKGSLPSSWIITPHEGELARLLKKKSSSLLKDRRASVEEAYQKFQCTVILKGSKTLIRSPEATDIAEINILSHGLAKAGTGDVLLGIICALEAQGLSPFLASQLGVFLHAEAARLYENTGHDHLSLRPLDLIENLPGTLKSLR